MNNRVSMENFSDRDAKVARAAHWDALAKTGGVSSKAQRYYRAWIRRVYGFVVPSGRSVLELGCGTGGLLASLKPSKGVGVDFSAHMLAIGAQQHPELEFVHADAHDVDLGDRTFDYIILSDLINDAYDVQLLLRNLRRYTSPDTRVVLNSFSHLWELPLTAARSMGLATPLMKQNWLTIDDVYGLLQLEGFEQVKQWDEFIWPWHGLGLGTLINRYLAKLWPFSLLTLAHLLVARRTQGRRARVGDEPYSVSVIVPARNEAGNIDQILARIPHMGSGTEIIFVEGDSSDATYEEIQARIDTGTRLPTRLFKQPGKGKGDAVRVGFNEAVGDVLMILDADLTVPPETLPRFYDALVSNRGELINGVRLVYPMNEEAMRFLNLVGNKFFSIAFSWLLGQPIKDTLCGTKVLFKTNYQSIAENRNYFGAFDPFGDFDLIFGAAKLNFKLIDLPVRYQARTYGATNIDRWKHGVLLLRMAATAARRLKFM